MLDVREVAIAMDCSVLAAGNHLNEAAARLKELDSKNLDGYALQLGKIYRTLGPDEHLVLTDIRRRVKTHYLPRTIWRISRNVLAVALFVGGAWLAWHAWQIVRHSMDH
jgi:hypothetical protein